MRPSTLRRLSVTVSLAMSGSKGVADSTLKPRDGQRRDSANLFAPKGIGSMTTLRYGNGEDFRWQMRRDRAAEQRREGRQRSPCHTARTRPRCVPSQLHRHALRHTPPHKIAHGGPREVVRDPTRRFTRSGCVRLRMVRHQWSRWVLAAVIALPPRADRRISHSWRRKPSGLTRLPD